LNKPKALNLRTALAASGALFFALLLVQTTANGVHANEADPPFIRRVKQLEGIVIGVAPEGESCEQRLNAMEMKLFGQIQGGPVLERVGKIQDNIAGVEEGESNGFPDAVTQMLDRPAASIQRAPVNGSISTTVMSEPTTAANSEHGPVHAVTDYPLQKVVIHQQYRWSSGGRKQADRQSACC
jgi:hypothetical protein